MRRRSLLAAALALPLLATAAQADGWGFRGGHTNDTGGIFPWSPDLRGHYLEIASSECARWNKIAYLTNVTAHYGGYVDFICRWPRGYDPRKGNFGPFRPNFWDPFFE